jgi:hypothetical protein
MGLTVKSLLSGVLSGTAQTYAPAAGKGAVKKWFFDVLSG